MVQASPLIAFTLGDKDKDGTLRTRHLRITFATLMELENGGTRSIMEKGTWEALEITEVATFVAAALKHEDPTVTPKYVGKFLGTHNLRYIFSVLATAWNVSQTGQAEYVPLEVVPLAA